MQKKIVRKLSRSFSQRGVVTTAKMLAFELYFEWKFKIKCLSYKVINCTFTDPGKNASQKYSAKYLTVPQWQDTISKLFELGGTNMK